MKEDQIHELLYQALETEAGGELIYKKAIACATNPDLKKEWQEYLQQTTNHHEILVSVFDALGLDARMETPGRQVVRHLGESLVMAMDMAKESAPQSAQIVAAECVVLAETKDHLNWTLIDAAAEGSSGKLASVLKEAVMQVEDQEDEHLYHTKGWTRELWIDSLGLPAVLPPPEEEKGVKTAIGAARAAQSRDDMVRKRR